MKLAWPKPVHPWSWLCQATGCVPLPKERGKALKATQGVVHSFRSKPTSASQLALDSSRVRLFCGSIASSALNAL